MPIKTTPTTREPLTWLFKAKFDDEHLIEQDLDDTCHSRTDGTGSAFSDVLAYGEDHRLVGFGLYKVDTPEYVWVDLISGNFVVNGTILSAANQNFEPIKYALELVYFRETRVEAHVNREGETVGTRHFVNAYFIGWKTEVNNKSKQVTLHVS